MASKLTIVNLNGVLCTVEANPAWMVYEVKEAIMASTGISVYAQRLFQAGVELEEDILVSKISGTEPICLTLVRREEAQAAWISRLQNGDIEALQSAPEEIRSDKDVMLSAVRAGAWRLEFASENIRADRQVVLCAVRQMGEALQWASEELRCDREVAFAAIRSDARAMFFAGAQIKRDPELALLALRGGCPLCALAPEVQADREMVLVAVRSSAFNFQDAAAEFRADREIALIAASDCYDFLQHASEELQADREVVMQAVRNNGAQLRHASSTMRADKEVVLAAIRSHFNSAGSPLQFASGELRNDRDVVVEAIRLNGSALHYAASKFFADRDIVLAAAAGGLGSSPLMCEDTQQSVASELLHDRDFMLDLLRHAPSFLKHAPHELQDDSEVVLAAAMIDGAAVENASQRLQGDCTLVLSVLRAGTKRAAHAFRYAAQELQADRELALAALEAQDLCEDYDAEVAEYIAEELWSDRNFILAAVQVSCLALERAAGELKADREIVLAAVQKCGSVLSAAASELTADREVVLTAIQNDPHALQCAASELRGDRDVVLAAVCQTGSALPYATEEVRADREVALTALRLNRQLSGDLDPFSALPSDLQADPEVLRAVRDSVLAYVSDEANEGGSLGWRMHCALMRYRNDREMVVACVQREGCMLKEACDFQADRDVVRAAVEQNGTALCYASLELQSDPDLIRAATEQQAKVTGSHAACNGIMTSLDQTRGREPIDRGRAHTGDCLSMELIPVKP